MTNKAQIYELKEMIRTIFGEKELYVEEQNKILIELLKYKDSHISQKDMLKDFLDVFKRIGKENLILKKELKKINCNVWKLKDYILLIACMIASVVGTYLYILKYGL